MDFQTKTNNAEIWFAQSLQMFEASKILIDSFQENKPIKSITDTSRKVGANKGIMFFLGMALENALKGVHVFNKIPEIKNGKLQSDQFKNKNKGSLHDLSIIASGLPITLTDDESELLKRLSVFTIWAAKYSTPLSEDEYLKSQNMLYSKHTSDLLVTETLIRKLKLSAGYNEKSGWSAINS